MQSASLINHLTCKAIYPLVRCYILLQPISSTHSFKASRVIHGEEAGDQIVDPNHSVGRYCPHSTPDSLHFIHRLLSTTGPPPPFISPETGSLVKAIIGLVRHQRSGESIDQDLINQVIESYIDAHSQKLFQLPASDQGFPRRKHCSRLSQKSRSGLRKKKMVLITTSS